MRASAWVIAALCMLGIVAGRCRIWGACVCIESMVIKDTVSATM